jgi:hypothetical protein
MDAFPGDDDHKPIGRADQVFVNSYPLRQVLARDKMTRGTFLADLEGQRCYTLYRAAPPDSLETTKGKQCRINR